MSKDSKPRTAEAELLFSFFLTKEYAKELREVQGKNSANSGLGEAHGLRVLLCSGRDGAGKGGTIRAITDARQSRSFGSWRARLR